LLSLSWAPPHAHTGLRTFQTMRADASCNARDTKRRYCRLLGPHPLLSSSSSTHAMPTHPASAEDGFVQWVCVCRSLYPLQASRCTANTGLHAIQEQLTAFSSARVAFGRVVTTHRAAADPPQIPHPPQLQRPRWRSPCRWRLRCPSRSWRWPSPSSASASAS